MSAAETRTGWLTDYLAEAAAAGPVRVTVSWPATIYLTVEVGDDGPRIVESEVYAKDSGVARILGQVHDIRYTDGSTAAIIGGAAAAETALEYVAAESWPNPTLRA